ncbi:MAG: hypothetical protein KDB53_13185, partial [Planctomycetes bacterium]|nr:hypothetical protein [Planctomycetota bacterium]
MKRLRDEVALQADTGDRDDLVKLYDQAIEAAERAKAFDKKVTDFDRQTQDAPTLLAALKEELAQPPAKDDPEFSLETTLREFEQFKQQSEAHRAAAQKLVDDLAGEAKHRTERQALLADEIARVGSLITQVESTLRGVSATDAVGTARQQALRWGLEALRAEDRALKAERAAYEARRETLPLRRDRAQRQLARAVFLTQFWEQRVADKRQQDAKQAVRDASAQRRATAARFPELEKFAKRNEEIAALSLGGQGILDQDVRAREALRQAESLLEEIKRRSRATRSKITVGGLTEGMGQLLRREYEWTRSASKLRAESEGRKDELSRAQLLQIDLQEDQDALRDLDDAQQKLVDSIEDTGPDSNTEELSALARELLETRAGLLPPRIDGLGKLINTLLDHERTHQQLVEETVAYRSYIEERILWVPSTAILIIPSTKTAREGFAWLTSASSWADALRKAESAVDRRLARYILAGLLLAFLVFYRRRMRRELVTKIDDVRATRQERYRLTLRAFALTWGLALPLPLVVHTAGLLLTGPRDQEEVARALGLALREVAFTFFVLEFLRQATKERHLAEMHLRWPSTSIGLLRSQLRWFLPVSLPLEVLSITFDRQSSTPIWSDTLGRIAFVALETALAVVMFRLLRPGAKLLAGHYRRRSSLLERSHALWSTLVVATPLALIGLALWGYYYSALQLQARLRDSLGLAIALLLINALLLRWLFVARGNLAIEQAKQRAQTRANAAGTTGEIAITESGILQAEEEALEISSLDTQTRQVIRSG